jgi:UDP-N-acetylmuramoyl-L-alanyl-D-glutamate--2,6-diaminopimelate ligase
MAFLAALIYGFPSRRLTVIGITGTKGKSTTVELVAHILKSCGFPVAVSSSVRNMDSGMTMPGCFKLERLLSRAVHDGSRYAVIEVTSQGVAQGRHLFIRWALAAFLNLAPEHIEAHGGFEKYRAAKVAFFSYVAKNKNAAFVVNKDDANTPYFERAASGCHIIPFGAVPEPTRLQGHFNGYNAGAALAIVSALGIDAARAREAIDSFPGVRGRMEAIGSGAVPFSVIIDYAVTPDSLSAVYKNFKGRNIIAVFGCTGGGRDIWKRPVMGAIAAEACAQIVLTDDDSYNEDPENIMRDIERGIQGVSSLEWKEGVNYWKIADRREAIRKGISLASPGDVVVITGKGGDAWLRVKGGKKIPWSDQDTARDILKEWE